MVGWIAHLVVEVGVRDDWDAWIVVVVVGVAGAGPWLRLVAVRGRQFQRQDHYECRPSLVCVFLHLMSPEYIEVIEFLTLLNFPS
jgi:hypothetical protein